MTGVTAADEIHILDEIVVKPGLARLYRDAYHADYVPMAQARGMTLRLSSRSPAVDIEGQATTLIFLWSIRDVGAWWGMRVRDGEAKAEWWRRSEPMTLSRKRLMLGDFGEEIDP